MRESPLKAKEPCDFHATSLACAGLQVSQSEADAITSSNDSQTPPGLPHTPVPIGRGGQECRAWDRAAQEQGRQRFCEGKVAARAGQRA